MGNINCYSDVTRLLDQRCSARRWAGGYGLKGSGVIEEIDERMRGMIVKEGNVIS